MREKTQEQQWLETLQYRQELTDEQMKQLTRDEKGFKGECYFDQLFDLFGPADSIFLDDLNLDQEGSVTQIDKLFLSGDTLYLVDMKNYTGKYALKNGLWYWNDQKLENNILYQIQRAQAILESILREKNLDLEVKIALVFVNRNCELQLPEKLPETILTEHQLPLWLRAKKFYVHDRFQKELEQHFLEIIKEKHVPAQALDDTIDIKEIKNLQAGVCCEECHQFGMIEKYHSFVCKNCGHEESKERAITRSICDFGVIFHQEELKIGNLCVFLGEDGNRNYIRSILVKHFEKMDNKGRGASYFNLHKEFDYWFLNKKKYFEHTEKRLEW